MRFALALTVAVAGCAATTNVPASQSAVAPGVKRYGPAVSTARSLGRRDNARRPSTSRSLRRRPVSARLDVQGVGVVTVEDRSAAGATDVDLYLGSDSGCEARAVTWGRRLLRVTEIR